jgi:hypothetical protein
MVLRPPTVNVGQALLTLGSVVLGGLIAALTNWWLKLRETRAEYAVRNRREVYSPLYEEVLALAETLRAHPFTPHIYTGLDFGRDLPPSYGRFQYWSRLKSDDRALRVPTDVRQAAERITPIVVEYNEVRGTCVDTVGAAVQSALTARAVQNRISNIGEVCASHVLAGTPEAREGFLRVCFSKDAPANADQVYADVCATAGKAADVARTRELGRTLAAAVAELERLLRARIEYILSKYEGRQPRV